MPSNLIGLFLLFTIIASAYPDNCNGEEARAPKAVQGSGGAAPTMGSGLSDSAVVAAAAASAARPQAQPQPQPQAPAQSQKQQPAPTASAQAQQDMGATARICRLNAASIAQEAALEAKAASDAQLMAGQQAAHQVKAQLAERAQQAAQAAQAALVGKEQMVEQLEEEVREAQAVVQEEGSSLAQAQQEVQAAAMSAQQAQQQLKVLTSAVQLEQANVGNAEQAASGAQQELAEKTQLVEAARRRVQMLLSQLSGARGDFTNTRQAADRAMAAAQEAKINAARNRREQPEEQEKEQAVPEAAQADGDMHHEVRREALDVQISAPEPHSTSATPPDMPREDASSCSATEVSSERHALERRDDVKHFASESVQGTNEGITSNTRSERSATETPAANPSNMATSKHETEVKKGTVRTSENESSEKNDRGADGTTSFSIQGGYASRALSTDRSVTELPETTGEVTLSNRPMVETNTQGTGYDKTVTPTEYVTDDVTNDHYSFRTTIRATEDRKRRDVSPVHLNGWDSNTFSYNKAPNEILQHQEILKNPETGEEYAYTDSSLVKEPIENTHNEPGVNKKSDIEKQYPDESGTDNSFVGEKCGRKIRSSNGFGDNQNTPSTNLDIDGQFSEEKKKRREVPTSHSEYEGVSTQLPNTEMPTTVDCNVIERRSNREISDLATPIPSQVEDGLSPGRIKDEQRQHREVSILQSQTVLGYTTQEPLTNGNPTKQPTQGKTIPPEIQFTQKDPEFMSVINSDAKINQGLANVDDHENIVPAVINEPEAVKVEEPNKGVAANNIDSPERSKRKATKLRVDSASKDEQNEYLADSAVSQKLFPTHFVEFSNREETKENHFNVHSDSIRPLNSLPGLKLKRSISGNDESYKSRGTKRQNRQVLQYKVSFGDEVSSSQINVDEGSKPKIQHLQTEYLNEKSDSVEQVKKQKRHLRNVSHLQRKEHLNVNNKEEEMKGERIEQEITDIPSDKTDNAEVGEVNETRPIKMTESRIESLAREMRATETANVEMKYKRQSQELRDLIKRNAGDEMIEEQRMKDDVIEPRNDNSVNKNDNAKQLKEKEIFQRDTQESKFTGIYNDKLEEKRGGERSESEILDTNTEKIDAEKNSEINNQGKYKKRREILELKTEQTVDDSCATPTPEKEERSQRDITDPRNERSLDNHNSANDVSDSSMNLRIKAVELRTPDWKTAQTEATLVRRKGQEGTEELQTQHNADEIRLSNVKC